MRETFTLLHSRLLLHCVMVSRLLDWKWQRDGMRKVPHENIVFKLTMALHVNVIVSVVLLLHNNLKKKFYFFSSLLERHSLPSWSWADWSIRWRVNKPQLTQLLIQTSNRPASCHEKLDECCCWIHNTRQLSIALYCTTLCQSIYQQAFRYTFSSIWHAKLAS